jgi:hypothetical protein
VATTLSVGDILRFRVYSRFGEQNGINVFHLLVTSIAAGTIRDVDVANDLSTLLAPLYKVLMGTQATYRGVSVERINAVPSQPYFNAADAGPGTATLDMMPPQTAGLINLRTPTAGRKGLGRKFIAFPAESQNDTDGTPTGGYVTNLTALANQLIGSKTVINPGGGNGSVAFALYNQTAASAIVLSQATARTKWSQVRRRSFIRRADQQPPL